MHPARLLPQTSASRSLSLSPQVRAAGSAAASGGVAWAACTSLLCSPYLPAQHQMACSVPALCAKAVLVLQSAVLAGSATSVPRPSCPISELPHPALDSADCHGTRPPPLLHLQWTSTCVCLSRWCWRRRGRGSSLIGRRAVRGAGRGRWRWSGAALEWC
jgi:hypothetical protein